MPARRQPKLDLDSPWKEALPRYLPSFLQFFFPHVHEAVDWTRGYASLDKELHRIMSEAEVGNRLADMLFKVWLHDGRETWLLIHIEVQASLTRHFHGACSSTTTASSICIIRECLAWPCCAMIGRIGSRASLPWTGSVAE